MADLKQLNTTIKPEQIFEIIIRYRWLILIPICISLTVSLIYAVVAKKTYEASTTILIQPQRVPSQYVQSVVSSDLDQRLSTISQQILSRSNLEKIIDQFGLYDEAAGMYLEDKVNDMRKRVEVKIDTTKGGRGNEPDVFYVSFKGQNPERVMRVANSLASYFMDENLKVREAQAVGTSEFLESELRKIQLVLEEKEKTLSEYRSKYIGGLPDELEANLRTLDRLQLQLSDRQSALRDLKNSADYQVDDFGKLKIIKTETEQLYELQKNKLDELSLKYTKNHPDIIKLVESVKQLKEKIEKERKENEQLSEGSSEKGNNSVAKSESFLSNPQLNIQKKIENEIKKAEFDISEIQKSMAFYQKKVEDTPKREQELQSLQRDYNNIRENYNSLLARKLESEIAVSMEKKQKGEQFRILDHARIPEKPISPDVRILLLISLAVGLGLGGGLAFLLEFLDTAIKSAEEVESEFGLPLLVSIPSLKKPENKFKKRAEMVLYSLFSLYAMSIFAIFVVINIEGLDRTVGFIKNKLNF